MSSYVRRMSVGEIIGECFSLYRKNFATIFALSLPGVLALFALTFMASMGDSPLVSLGVRLLRSSGTGNLLLLILLGALVFMIVIVVLGISSAAITVAMSDICLGHRPGIARSFRYVFGPIIWKLLATNLLGAVVVGLGLVLLVVPGIFLWTWLAFCSIIVVMENTWGLSAFKRSKRLGNGYHLRTLGLLLLFVILGALVGSAMGLVNFLLDEHVFARLLENTVRSLLQPLGLIAIVLCYYDLRVRKEDYDITALAEDLDH